MATDAGARPWGLLLLLALSLCFSISEVRADTVNLCGLSPPAAPGESCQINCFRYDPVCGDNGVTYGCGCPEADCNGVPVVKLGEIRIKFSKNLSNNKRWTSRLFFVTYKKSNAERWGFPIWVKDLTSLDSISLINGEEVKMFDQLHNVIVDKVILAITASPFEVRARARAIKDDEEEEVAP
ncbi:hypothetical protein Taro_038813 [Colocasia esculenta]|uniref:Uncharacterized protein n=1 Tax=Colocasia esculenta TaxID=4460 RepID=A0A843WDX2_COLES|nr:hypothetical protein [Colocasia esculenta]